ncbi:MAG: YCF48-related protein [Pirellulales bacterium]|nr:YCF48-related protein [Pirellulales bacterium]
MSSRYHFARAALLLWGLLVAGWATNTGAQHPDPGGPSPLQAAWRNDAELADVTFVDALHGWAVGDHGAIWHTANGGEHWHPQHSPVRCSIRSVYFLNQRTGWAVGGVSHRYTHVTSGIVLRTDDGGAHWVEWQRNPLPSLSKIEFFNMQQGYAIGGSSAMYPQGLLLTNDGGRSWTAPPDDQPYRWLDGDFRDPAHGSLSAAGGVAAAMRKGAFLPAEVTDSAGSALRSIHYNDENIAYAVGDNGKLFATRDGGLHWQPNNSPFFDRLPTSFSPHTVTSQGPLIWIAGSPGTRILHSPDGGSHWEFQETGQRLPLHDLHFADQQKGWAVGAMGTIVATKDGGKTWKLQKGDPKRAAILGVFPTARDVPLKLFAKLSAGEGYRSSVALIGRDAPTLVSTPFDIPEQRTRDALIQSGVTAVDRAPRFPLPTRGLNLPAEEICRNWPLRDGQHAERMLQAYLVQQIRIWRPDIIVTMEARPRGEDHFATLLNQILLQAVKKAASADASPLGVQPWQVSKVYTALPPRSVGSLQLSGSQLIPRLGASLDEYVARAHSYLHTQHEPQESHLGFTRLICTLPVNGNRDFFSGLNLLPGGDARRTMPDMPMDIAHYRQSAKLAETLRGIVSSAGRGQPSNSAWIGQIHRVARDLPPALCGEVFFDLANGYHQRGEWALAAQTLALMIDQCPDHPLSGRALQWLIQYHASGEAHRRATAKRGATARQVRVELPVGAGAVVRPPENIPPKNAQLGSVQQSTTALQWGAHLRKTNPNLHADPSIQFPLAAAHRQTGKPRHAQTIYRNIKASPWLGAWSSCGAHELSVAGPAGKTQKTSQTPLWICSRANEKPFLDGHLKEACWVRSESEKRGSEQTRLALVGRTTGQRDVPTTIQACCDNEYLYFAIECHKAPGRDYPRDTSPRIRDALLGDEDRVDLWIDIDRDYATYYQFSVDANGRTYDACWNDPSWNPEWFVASHATENSWTCEVAIPLKELTTDPTAEKRRWVLGVQRTIPGVGILSWGGASWTDAADEQMNPSRFGHLQLP